MGLPLCRSLPSLALLLAAPAVLAGGLQPTARPALDPAEVADLSILQDGPPTVRRTFAWGGAFVGDLNGDGRDDVVLPSSTGERLELFFGAELEEDPESRGEDGDATLELPTGCRQADDRIHFAALGDVDGDGFADLGVACPAADELDLAVVSRGAVALYFGRASWPSAVSEPDTLLRGVPDDPVDDPALAEHVGLRIGALGDIDGDGFADFAVGGVRWDDPEEPFAWIFHGSATADVDLDDTADATWRVVGGILRCLGRLGASALGDIDADGRGDFALYCPEQPSTQTEGSDISFSAFLGGDVMALPPGDIAFGDRSFRWAVSALRVPQARPTNALGDLDGNPGDEFAVINYLDFSGTQQPFGRVILGGPGPWEDLDILEPLYPGFDQGEDDWDHPEALQLAPAGDLFGDGNKLWMRTGHGAEARIGLLDSPDPSLWADSEVPPLRVVFSPPAGLDPGEDWRLGLGGPGDFDGDGTDDLLITGGHGEDGCDPLACGGAWLILCRDVDGDGSSPCTGDCDDADAAVGPLVPEQCDAIDHDCDGEDGLADGDGDGVLGCEGDCDDTDPEIAPGFAEDCDAGRDVNCDGLVPLEDVDGDLAVNCEDCQPWMPAVNPDADEICDGLDTDCDGRVCDEERDVDRDGAMGCSPGLLCGQDDLDPDDCDDLNPFVGPHRWEDCENGIDDDCDGAIDEAQDGDSDQVSSCQGDCDDSRADVFPGAEELCDGLDNDCDGDVDEGRDFDDDGLSRCQGDCDDNDPAIGAGFVGVCDPGVDGNCDGLPDLEDGDGDGFSACSGDCNDADPGIAPTGLDWCDGLDNDCDGVVDGPWDSDLDSWASCLGDCDDSAPDRFPRVREPICDDDIDGDCDNRVDGVDPDCPAPIEEEPPPLRPLGLSCANCRSDVSGGGGLALLLLLGLRRRRKTPVRPWLVGLLVLAFAVPAHAARKEPTMLVYLSRLPDLRAMTAATKVADESGLKAVEVVHHSELFDATTMGLVVDGASRRETCPEDTPAPVLSQASSDALDALISLDYELGRSILDEAIGRLACIDKAVPRRLVADLLFYRGVVRQGLGDDVAAAEDFANVLAMEPEYPGDPNFPPEVDALLSASRTEAATLAPVTVWVYAPLGARVRIDGLERDAEGPVSLAPGTHILQLVRGRDLDTAVVRLDPGRTVLALLAGDRSRALQEVEGNSAARTFARQVLGLAAADAGATVAAVVDLDVPIEPLRYVLRAADGAFSFEPAYAEAPPGGGRASSPRPKRKPRSKATAGNANPRVATGSSSGAPAGSSGGAATGPAAGPGPRVGASVAPGERKLDRVRIRVGGGFVWAHPFPYGQIPLDLSFRLVAGLTIDLSGEISTPGATDYGWIFLPTVAIGASYRFGNAAVQPRIGGVFRLGFDNEAEVIEVAPGWAVRGGADFVPPAGPVLFGLDLHVGMLTRAFYGSLSGTVGLRF